MLIDYVAEHKLAPEVIIFFEVCVDFLRAVLSVLINAFFVFRESRKNVRCSYHFAKVAYPFFGYFSAHPAYGLA